MTDYAEGGFAGEHDPRSEELFRALAEIDFNQFGDFFCWKSGGDGDNGEIMMTQLDIYFREKDEASHDRDG